MCACVWNNIYIYILKSFLFKSTIFLKKYQDIDNISELQIIESKNLL